MKRSEINAAIKRAIANAKQHGVHLPKWADWTPDKFEASADGMRHQKLGWKVVSIGHERNKIMNRPEFQEMMMMKKGLSPQDCKKVYLKARFEEIDVTL